MSIVKISLTLVSSLIIIFSFNSTALAKLITLDKIIVSINEESITDLMFNDAVQREMQIIKTSQQAIPNIDDLKVVIAKRLLDQGLLNSQARILDVKIKQEEIDNEITNIKKNNKLDDASFENFLYNENITMGEFSLNISNQIKRQKLIDNFVKYRINMDENSLFDYYNKHFAKTNLRYKSRSFSIMLPSTSNVADQALALEQMNDYYHELKTGDLDAIKLKEIFRSDSQMQVKEFDMLKSELLSSFVDALINLEPGTFSIPFASSFGVHIVELIKIKAEPIASFDNMKEEVQSAYYRSEFNHYYEAYIDELFKEAKIDYKDQKFAGYISQYEENPDKYTK
ncbi:MAG: SurA N-terminal domain-containing protein [SAR324 cluster bacterium]|nr:SurA N-terminal domain-containing protein [SAR324 cluster bacterium]